MAIQVHLRKLEHEYMNKQMNPSQKMLLDYESVKNTIHYTILLIINKIYNIIYNNTQE